MDSKPPSRRSKPSSGLPVHPEPDLNHRRSGIRHFSDVPSMRRKDQKLRKFSNFGKPKSKLCSAMGPMQWRDRINQNACRQSSEHGDLPQTTEGIANATAREQQAINELKNIHRLRDPTRMMRRVPVKGKGFMLVPQPIGTHDQPALRLEYPYFQHFPAAATVQPHHPHDSLTTTPAGHCAAVPGEPVVNITLEKAILVACGISIAIGILTAWIFRHEVIKYGGILGAVTLVWKLSQWNTQVRLYYREQQLIREGRLVPAQPASQHYVINETPLSHQIYEQAVIIPGGWAT